MNFVDESVCLMTNKSRKVINFVDHSTPLYFTVSSAVHARVFFHNLLAAISSVSQLFSATIHEQYPVMGQYTRE
jgi:hypothetical protein